MLQELDNPMEEKENPTFQSNAHDSTARRLSKMIHAQEFLSREEEQRLFKLVKEKDDKKARETLILSHMRLANYHAGNLAYYNRKNILNSHEDLLQEAILGLDYAVSQFDTDKGVRFSTYAQYWIRSYLQIYVHRNTFSVHVSATSGVRFLIKRIKKLKEDLLKHDPNLALNIPQLCLRMAEESNINIELVKSVYSLMHLNPLELNKRQAYLSDDDGVELDLPDNRDEFSSVDYGIDMEKFYTIIQNFMKALPDRDRFIIENRYFIPDVEDSWSLEMLGEKFKISKERVRQIEVRVLKEMKSLLNGNVVRSRKTETGRAEKTIQKIEKFRF